MDNKAIVSIKFEIFGKKFKQEWYINYMGYEGVDDRIIEWFEDCWDVAYSKYEADTMEKEEREALARLKEKYENPELLEH